jgi:hypothetical protein
MQLIVFKYSIVPLFESEKLKNIQLISTNNNNDLTMSGLDKIDDLKLDDLDKIDQDLYK